MWIACARRATCGTVRASRTTSERPCCAGYSKGSWLGQVGGTKVHGACTVAGGQSGWVPPGRSGEHVRCSLQAIWGGGWAFCRAVCLEPFHLLPRLVVAAPLGTVGVGAALVPLPRWFGGRSLWACARALAFGCPSVVGGCAVLSLLPQPPWWALKKKKNVDLQ